MATRTRLLAPSAPAASLGVRNAALAAAVFLRKSRRVSPIIRTPGGSDRVAPRLSQRRLTSGEKPLAHLLILPRPPGVYPRTLPAAVSRSLHPIGGIRLRSVGCP